MTELGSGTMGDALASTVRLRRRHLSLSQGELADLAGVSERFVNALENGKRTVQLDKLLAVLFTLGLHLELRRGGARGIRSAVGGDATTRSENQPR
ncbi:type II toxin-antitoxin system Y4mF family antitoxin [Polymorphospora lycopeni]|uniref:type II toxin-antitoxin system Y4mF family antitoxin n=2 Tax=Polymorphospora TaxID=338583 RepID=UPI0035D407E5